METATLRTLRQMETSIAAAQAAADAAGSASTYPVVVRDIDYTAEANATLTDGAVTLGGVSHTVQNSAGASQFDVVAGTGIIIRYKTSGAGNLVITSSNSAPGIWAYAQDLIPDFSPLHRYLYVWHYDVRADDITYDGSAEASVFFLQKAGGLSSVDVEYTESSSDYAAGGLLRGYNASATNGISWQVSNEGTLVRAWYRLDDYDNVAAVMSRDGFVLEAFAGAYGDDWPSLDAMRAVGRVTATTGQSDSSYYNLGLTRVIAAIVGSTGAADPHGVDIHRLRIYDLGI